VDFNFVGVYVDRLHLAIGWLEANPRAFSMKTLECDLICVREHGGNHIVVLGLPYGLKNDHIPFVDEGVNHREALNFQRINVPAATGQVSGNINAV
jgi:hypothetical protein